MFDISFWELALLALVALVVLGPERLPVVARTAGRWIARARRYAAGLSEEFDSHEDLRNIREELNRTREEIQQASDRFMSDAKSAVDDVETAAQKARDDVADSAQAMSDDVEKHTQLDGFGDVDDYVSEYLTKIPEEAPRPSQTQELAEDEEPTVTTEARVEAEIDAEIEAQAKIRADAESGLQAATQGSVDGAAAETDAGREQQTLHDSEHRA